MYVTELQAYDLQTTLIKQQLKRAEAFGTGPRR